MADVTETQLPGVGVRHEFTTDAGDRVAVLSHRGGRRDLMIYDREDPDSCAAVLHVSSDEAHTLSELLGASRVSESVAQAVQQQIEGLAIEWITVPRDAARMTIGEGDFRTRTGVSIVAIVRGDDTIPAPGPEHSLEGGDVAVAVGTPAGLDELRELLRG